ncbi:MAG TPA: DUF6445 family protein [Brevundimonas sp.]|nr:DUF6445 family protein [Brevundimonas sp.]
MAHPSFIMVDDFVGNPDELRQRALGLDYGGSGEKQNYPGVTSSQPIRIDGLEEYVSRLLGVEVVGAPGTLHGHCRLTLGRDRGQSGVHVDPAFYSGILYLSRPQDVRGGTDFYRHRRTGLESVPSKAEGLLTSGFADVNHLIEDVVNRDTLKPSAWQRTFTSPMRYNRLALFSPWMFHNSSAGFGETAETGRLVYLMFFAARG